MGGKAERRRAWVEEGGTSQRRDGNLSGRRGRMAHRGAIMATFRIRDRPTQGGWSQASIENYRTAPNERVRRYRETISRRGMEKNGKRKKKGKSLICFRGKAGRAPAVRRRGHDD